MDQRLREVESRQAVLEERLGHLANKADRAITKIEETHNQVVGLASQFSKTVAVRDAQRAADGKLSKVILGGVVSIGVAVTVMVIRSFVA